MRILVMNAGSSTLKWTLLDAGDGATVDAGSAAWAAPDLDGRIAEVRRVLRGISRFDAVGHRVVHGGARFVAPTVIEGAVRAELEALAVLDPIHMRPALAIIDAVSAEFPTVTQVASFDTAFHATLPAAAARYALPFEWSERWGLRRFGFHGLSVQYSLARTRELLGRTPAKLVVCHLGGGCSITAVRDGRSIDNTMGFTPLEGVMMATRSGSVDPGLLLHVVSQCGVGVDELGDALAHRSGLLGVSGVSGDLRRVREAIAQHSARARLAYDQFIWSLRRSIGAMVAVLGGVDALVFTGGIGENDAGVRGDVADALAFGGLRLRTDDDGAGDRLLSTSDSAIAALVVHAREDLVILDEVRNALRRPEEP